MQTTTFGLPPQDALARNGAGRASHVRVASVDLSRGIIMIVMALDHVRDYFTPFTYDPTDIANTSVGLFLTRWITHFCAPVFTFLAGTSAYLYARNGGKSRGELQTFLVTRGLWLVLLEVTYVSFCWQFGYGGMILQTIWALGWSMVALAALVMLPLPAIAAIGALMVVGHNALDGIHGSDLGAYALPWAIAHEFYFDRITPHFYIAVGYPLVPWIGVMALGYVFGRVLEMPAQRRDRVAIALGLTLTAAFIALRLINVYGDPRPWAISDRGLPYTLLSFLNTTKYPPSLLYLSMTLGPALLTLPLLERWRGVWADRVAVFGRVPFFFYMLHLPLIHLAALIWTYTAFGATTLGDFFHTELPATYTPSLARAYLVWAATILVLYPLCRRYAEYKRAHRERWWLGYL
jgi:uncharacterized membrane protein